MNAHATHWTPEQEATLTAMFNEGATVGEIADALGRSINAIDNRRQLLGLLIPPQRPGRRVDLWPRPRGFDAKAVRWARRTFRPAEFRRDMTGDNGEAAMILAFLRDPAAKGAAA